MSLFLTTHTGVELQDAEVPLHSHQTSRLRQDRPGELFHSHIFAHTHCLRYPFILLSFFRYFLLFCVAVSFFSSLSHTHLSQTLIPLSFTRSIRGLSVRRTTKQFAFGIGRAARASPLSLVSHLMSAVGSHTHTTIAHPPSFEMYFDIFL